MFSFIKSEGDRADTLAARMARARREGYVRGAREGRMFKLALGREFLRRQAVDWINTAIDDGRAELYDQHAIEREIEVWDMSCRIMFMTVVAAA